MSAKQEAIEKAYEQLSDGDKINIDLQVKRLLDRFAAINQERTGAKFQFSRSMALELLHSLGAWMKGKEVYHD
jgi:hypothetical protein